MRPKPGDDGDVQASGGRRIGGSLRDAISWTQDTLRITRPLAEQVVLAAMADGQVAWGGGQGDARALFLLEDDDELEKRRREAAHKTATSHSVSKRWRRSSFRNASRHRSPGRHATAKVAQQATGTFSGAAEEMEQRSLVTLRPVDREEEDRESPKGYARGGT